MRIVLIGTDWLFGSSNSRKQHSLDRTADKGGVTSLLEKLDCIFGPSIKKLLKDGLGINMPMDQKSMARRARGRPANFMGLPPQEQWAIDKELGILDWDGTEGSNGT
jgi:hypothetical protein